MDSSNQTYAPSQASWGPYWSPVFRCYTWDMYSRDGSQLLTVDNTSNVLGYSQVVPQGSLQQPSFVYTQVGSYRAQQAQQSDNGSVVSENPTSDNVGQGMYPTPAPAQYTSPYAPVAPQSTYMQPAESIYPSYPQPGTEAAGQQGDSLLKVNGYTQHWLQVNFGEGNLTRLLKMARDEFDNDKWEFDYQDGSGDFHKLRIIQCASDHCDYFLIRPHKKFRPHSSKDSKRGYMEVAGYTDNAKRGNKCGNHQ